ncbi:DUF418 domain-containing protein [Bacillus sp. FJAT-27445]|uniref:DUF418 domain-containing protein n=1 Tax=Bacillus sp. FJAT-27445 TaxID=1679166 RepID=UPI000ABE71E4|nr:DUF418 domain-containing protein [Bacillus sp. FJAT-27445]
MDHKLEPTLEGKRITSLDTMRGFAILGIYLVNMLSFHSPYLFIDPLTWWDKGLDRKVYILIDVFAQASFYPLFSMLFGYGLMMMRERTIGRGSNFKVVAARRLVFLLAVGMIHAFLIWPGDILITYACIGFIALFFLRLSGRALFATAIVMYIIPNLLLGLLLLAADMLGPVGEFSRFNYTDSQHALTVYGNGSFQEITEMRMYEWKFGNNSETFPIKLFSILPLFLLGAAVAKLKWLAEPKLHVRKLKAAAFGFLVPALAIKTLPYYGWEGYSAEFFQDIFGGPLLAIGYAGIVALAVEKFGVAAGPLAIVGRMSMTNYLFQSFLSTFIFYGYGAGLYGNVTVALGTLLVFAVFLFQLFASTVWLKKFKYGPVEWMWRSFTYFTRQKMRREETS